MISKVLMCVAIAALTSSCHAEDVAPTSLIEWWCLSVQLPSANCSIHVDRAKLDWGKWVEDPYQNRFDEIQSPEGSKLIGKENYRICSAGRESSPSGTSGELKLKYVDDQDKNQGQFTVTFNCPWQAQPSFHAYMEGLKVKHFLKQAGANRGLELQITDKQVD